MLIVDDVFSSGHSIQAVKTRLQQTLKRNYPCNVKTAVLWHRPNSSRADARPDYFLHTTDEWLVFPYELKGLSLEEIQENKPLVDPFIRNL